MSMFGFFLDLFDHNSYSTMRRDKWPEGVYIYGKNLRHVKEEDVESTLFFDPVISHYNKIHGHDADIIFKKDIMMVDEEGMHRAWRPTSEDYFADDWTLHDHTEAIKSMVKLDD